MNSLKSGTLEEKEIIAKNSILDAIEKAKNPFVLFDGDNYSVIILHMVREIQKTPVLFIDTSVKFKEIYQFIEKMRKLWGFKLIRESNEAVLKTIKFGEDRNKCCNMLKTKAIEDAIKKHNIDILFAYEDEEIKKDMELFKIEDSQIVIYPIMHFSREDVLNYIKKYNLPYCSLYDKGYKDIQCTPCTLPITPKDEQLEKQDEEEIKKRLKALGYM